MVSNNLLQSKYFTTQCVKDRNSITVNNWGAYVSQSAIPDQPDDNWIRQRIQADNVPVNLTLMVTQTIAYFAQNEITQTNIQQFINANNDDATEVALSGQNESIIAAFAPQWCATTISQPQVDAWRKDHDKPAPEAKKK